MIFAQQTIEQLIAWALFLFIIQIIIWILIRPIILWYFGIRERTEIMEKQLQELRSIRVELQEQTKWQQLAASREDEKKNTENFSAER